MTNELRKYTMTAFHVEENDTHPVHEFYAENIEEALKIYDKMFDELYGNDENADCEFHPLDKEENDEYYEHDYTEEQKQLLVELGMR